MKILQARHLVNISNDSTRGYRNLA